MDQSFGIVATLTTNRAQGLSIDTIEGLTQAVLDSVGPEEFSTDVDDNAKNLIHR